MVYLKTKLPALSIIILFFSVSLGHPRPVSYSNPSPVSITDSSRNSTAKSSGTTPAKSYHLQFMLDNWNSDKGLPQNSVVDLARTKDGYLWIGTQEGVSRFDGIGFKTFRDPKVWAEQAIFTNVILAASDNSLWVGTREGLNQIKNEQFRTYTINSGLPGKYITALCTATRPRTMLESSSPLVSGIRPRPASTSPVPRTTRPKSGIMKVIAKLPRP